MPRPKPKWEFVPPDERTTYYNTFDEYVADYPEAEHFRNWLTNRNAALLIFASRYTAMEGEYCWVHYVSSRELLMVSDGDDGACAIPCLLEEVEDKLEVLRTLAPVSMGELVELFEYQWD